MNDASDRERYSVMKAGGELTPCVFSWVVYQEPNYRGPHYILEKRDYNSFSDWGSQNTTVGSMRRIRFS